MAVRIEWDENKDRANIAKHGIEFAAVAAVFDDPLSLTIPDRVTDGELRYRTIGATPNGVVLVAYAARSSRKRRIGPHHLGSVRDIIGKEGI